MTERLEGDGKVFKGQQFIADVHYELQIHSRHKDTGTMTSEGRLLIDKDVFLQVSPATAVSGHLGENLTLHMSDGQKQNFLVRTSNGDCKGTGGPYK